MVVVPAEKILEKKKEEELDLKIDVIYKITERARSRKAERPSPFQRKKERNFSVTEQIF